LLAFSVIQAQLSRYGELMDVSFQTNAAGQTMGIALVTFSERAACQKVIDDWNNKIVDGMLNGNE
jgi:RNA recognition motif-containing protein